MSTSEPQTPDPHTPGPNTPGPNTPGPGNDNDGQPRKSKAPILIAGGALLALLLVVGLVAGLVSRAGPSGTPTAEQQATRAPLELPLRVNEMQRDPNAQGPSVAPTPGAELSTTTAVYLVDGTQNLVVVAGRPVRDPNEMLAMVDARAVRQIGNGLCGRESSQDIDLCVVTRGDTAVMGGGLADQSVEQIVAQSQAVLQALPE